MAAKRPGCRRKRRQARCKTRAAHVHRRAVDRRHTAWYASSSLSGRRRPHRARPQRACKEQLVARQSGLPHSQVRAATQECRGGAHLPAARTSRRKPSRAILRHCAGRKGSPWSWRRLRTSISKRSWRARTFRMPGAPCTARGPAPSWRGGHGVSAVTRLTRTACSSVRRAASEQASAVFRGLLQPCSPLSSQISQSSPSGRCVTIRLRWKDSNRVDTQMPRAAKVAHKLSKPEAASSGVSACGSSGCAAMVTTVALRTPTCRAKSIR